MKGLFYRWCPRLPHDQGLSLPIVSEPSFSHIQAPRCRWFLRLLHDQGPKMPTLAEALAHHSTEVPMVPEAPARPRA
ncbi:hypothetical protein GOBAR_DD19273 [Gossypium barbadense]|nr:hypothetical protein GOBAR_DD19273 [Gossypium barbadense]